MDYQEAIEFMEAELKSTELLMGDYSDESVVAYLEALSILLESAKYLHGCSVRGGKEMQQEQLNKILELHKKWLQDESGGERANLRYADLSGANLNGADLRYVNTLLLQGMTVIECQLNTSNQNRRISYWKDLDIVTVGCYQGTWAEFKERVQQVHGDSPVMKRKYDRVIAFIEAEVEEEE